jgi:hypothetical protein
MEFSEGWTRWTGEGPQKSRLFYAKEAGRRVRFTAKGSTITLIHKVGPDCGIARILIDGKPGPLADLDTYSETVDWNRRTVLAGNLPNGRHTVVIETTALANPRSSDGYVQIVGFENANQEP